MPSSKKTPRHNRFLCLWDDNGHQIYNLTDIEDRIILEKLQENFITIYPNIKNLILHASLIKHLNPEIYVWSTDKMTETELDILIKTSNNNIKDEIRKTGDKIFSTSKKYSLTDRSS